MTWAIIAFIAVILWTLFLIILVAAFIEEDQKYQIKLEERRKNARR